MHIIDLKLQDVLSEDIFSYTGGKTVVTYWSSGILVVSQWSHTDHLAIYGFVKDTPEQDLLHALCSPSPSPSVWSLLLQQITSCSLSPYSHSPTLHPLTSYVDPTVNLFLTSFSPHICFIGPEPQQAFPGKPQAIPARKLGRLPT